MTDSRDRVLDIAVAVNSATKLDDLVRVVMERIGEILPHDRASLALVDPASGALTLRDLAYTVPNGGSLRADRGKRIPIDESNVLGWAFLHRRPHLRTGTEDDAGFEPQQSGEEARSHIVCPLLGREEILGLLNIGSFSPGAFRREDVPTFAAYARLTAVAIENLRNYEAARESSIRDGLTGAYNHRHLKEVLEQEANRTRRYGSNFSLILLDIDHFKSFNDRFGHQAGDRVLARTAALLQANLRPSDLVFRYGGEEFAVLLPSAGAGQALHVAEKLVRTLRRENLFRPDRDHVEPVTASMGVATAPGDAGGRDAILACADQALYHAKAAGRARAVAFSRIAETMRLDRRLTPDGSVPEFLLLASGVPEDCTNRGVIVAADLLARALSLSPEERTNARIAAFFHDVGEAGLPRDLLERPGPLDARERTLVRQHPVVGETLLSRVLRIGSVLQAVLHHKERYDGGGGPAGLRAEQIPLLARILSVAVIFDALTSDRPYRNAYRVAEAYELMRGLAGYELDPGLVDRFIAARTAAVESGSGGIA